MMMNDDAPRPTPQCDVFLFFLHSTTLSLLFLVVLFFSLKDYKQDHQTKSPKYMLFWFVPPSPWGLFSKSCLSHWESERLFVYRSVSEMAANKRLLHWIVLGGFLPLYFWQPFNLWNVFVEHCHALVLLLISCWCYTLEDVIVHIGLDWVILWNSAIHTLERKPWLWLVILAA